MAMAAPHNRSDYVAVDLIPLRSALHIKLVRFPTLVIYFHVFGIDWVEAHTPLFVVCAQLGRGISVEESYERLCNVFADVFDLELDIQEGFQ